MSTYPIEFKDLEEENERLRAKLKKAEEIMRLHAGDICSANNEAERFIGANQDLEEENEKLRAKNKILRGTLTESAKRFKRMGKTHFEINGALKENKDG